MLTLLSEALPYGNMLSHAGAAIVVAGIPKKSFPGTEQAFWIQDCSAATENILLAVESLGLGAVWIGVFPNKDRVFVLQKLLECPPGVIPLNVISIGYPTGFEQPKNKFNAKNVHWERW